MTAPAETVAVHLLGTPLELLVAGREHHEGLVREFRLMELSGRVAAPDAPARLVELTAVLGQQYGSANDAVDAEVDRALARGEVVRDLVRVVPPSVVDATEQLSALMAEADAYCAAEQLLTLERPPLLKRFGEWYLGQFAVQCTGGPPTPWDGPTALPGP